MKERVLEFLKAENKSSAQLAEEIGVQPSGISHILSGRNNPSLDFILKMLEKYQFISSDWLLFGKGNMYKEPSMQSLFNESTDIGKAEPVKHIVTEPDTTEKTYIEKDMPVSDHKSELTVEKIVWFYNDKSFREYFPDR
jgi:transcriptional regulator with XRE-family HTH domain